LKQLVTYLRELLNGFVFLHKRTVGRAIVVHNNLKRNLQRLTLPVQSRYKVGAQAVVCRQKYGYSFIHFIQKPP
jgi:hypothetical protein